MQDINQLRGKIATVVSEYVADNIACEACVDRVVVEVQSEDLVQIIGDTDLVNTVKNNFGVTALLVLHQVPEPDTLIMEKATVYNLTTYIARLDKEAKLTALKDLLEDAMGASLEPGSKLAEDLQFLFD